MSMAIRGLRHWIAWGLITIKGLEGTVEPAENLLYDWTDDHPPHEGFAASIWKHQPSNPAQVLIDGKLDLNDWTSSQPFLHPDSSSFLLDHNYQGQHLRDTFSPIENVIDSIFEDDQRRSFASSSENCKDSNAADDAHVYPGVLSMDHSLFQSTNSLLAIHQEAEPLHANLKPIGNWVGGNSMNDQVRSFSAASSYHQGYDMENMNLHSQLEQDKLHYDLIYGQLKSSDGSLARQHEDRPPMEWITQQNILRLGHNSQEPDPFIGIYEHLETYLRPGSTVQHPDASTQNYQELEPGSYASYDHLGGCSATAPEAELKHRHSLVSNLHSQEMYFPGNNFRNYPEDLSVDWATWHEPQVNLVHLEALSNPTLPGKSQQPVEVCQNQFMNHPRLDSNCLPRNNPNFTSQPKSDIFDLCDPLQRSFGQRESAAIKSKKQKKTISSFQGDCESSFKGKEAIKLQQSLKNHASKDNALDNKRSRLDVRNSISTQKQVKYAIHNKDFDGSNLLKFDINAFKYFKDNASSITDTYNTRRLQSLIECLKSFENEEIDIKNVDQFDLLLISCRKCQEKSGMTRAMLKSKGKNRFYLKRCSLKISRNFLFSHVSLWLQYWETKYQSKKCEKLELQSRFWNIVSNYLHIPNIRRSQKNVPKLCIVFLFYVDMLNTILGTEDESIEMDKNFSGLYFNQKSAHNVAEKSTESTLEKALNFFQDFSLKDALIKEKEIEIELNPICIQRRENFQSQLIKHPSEMMRHPEFEVVLWCYLKAWIREFSGQLRYKNKELYERINDLKSSRAIMNCIFAFSIHYLTSLLQSRFQTIALATQGKVEMK